MTERPNVAYEGYLKHVGTGAETKESLRAFFRKKFPFVMLILLAAGFTLWTLAKFMAWVYSEEEGGSILGGVSWDSPLTYLVLIGLGIVCWGAWHSKDSKGPKLAASILGFIAFLAFLFALFFFVIYGNNAPAKIKTITSAGATYIDGALSDTPDKVATELPQNKVGCEPVKLFVEPGETALFKRNEFCLNLDWLREDGATLEVTFEGNDGTDFRKWKSATRMPIYDGIVDTASIKNTGEKSGNSVLVTFFYKN